VNWLSRLTQREYSRVQQIAALLVGQVLFLVVYPVFIVLGAWWIDQYLSLPRLAHGLANPCVALALILPGLILVEWTVGLQFARGLGTPLPVVPTRRLLTNGPYSYSRNPMATGATMVYVGVAVGVGSLSAVALACIYPTAITVYTRLIEEKELERRFGSEYVAYKKRTPFLMPRPSRRDWP
jgi:protein-S-isoprenylcysteine O-methyltransferase Ste14